MQNTRQATANTSRNQPHAGPALRPLCRSLSIDRETGAVEYESTSRGAVSYLNDLHKGRNAGPAWGWFLDVFAVACLVFCITGLFLLHLHARQRRKTWPLVGLGLMITLLIALLLIH